MNAIVPRGPRGQPRANLAARAGDEQERTVKYSDWQLNRLRDSLSAYHHYERSHDGHYFTWKDVSEAIDEYTGVRVPPERLRQFVEGVNTKDGSRKFPVPQEKSIEGIASFVVHEDLNLLTEDELEEFTPNRQAPLRLLEYLDQQFDQERIVPSEKIQGRYVMRVSGPDGITVRELTLQLPSADGLMQVVETEDSYGVAAAMLFEHGTPADLKANRDYRVKHGGWAILTPEDNLLFFLKNEEYGKNRYYLTMALDLQHWSEAPITRLVLLHHDFPVELEESDAGRESLAEHAVSEMTKNLLVFERHTESA